MRCGPWGRQAATSVGCAGSATSTTSIAADAAWPIVPSTPLPAPWATPRFRPRGFGRHARGELDRGLLIGDILAIAGDPPYDVTIGPVVPFGRPESGHVTVTLAYDFGPVARCVRLTREDGRWCVTAVSALPAAAGASRENRAVAPMR